MTVSTDILAQPEGQRGLEGNVSERCGPTIICQFKLMYAFIKFMINQTLGDPEKDGNRKIPP